MTYTRVTGLCAFQYQLKMRKLAAMAKHETEVEAKCKESRIAWLTVATSEQECQCIV